MNFTAACDWSLTRSLLVALLAWPACVALERGLRASRRPLLFLWLLVSPFLFPELLIGYLFAPWTAGRPWRAELLCSLVLLVRSAPIGVVTLWNVPATDVSPAALHLRRLKLRSITDAWELGRCYWRSSIRRALPALGLMFLITFQEFEAAALLGAISWTDQLFMEYATGLSLSDSIRFLIRPLAMQFAVLTLTGWSWWRPSGADSQLDREQERPVRPLTVHLAESACVLTFLIGVALPLCLLSREFTAGWTWLWTQPSAGRTLATEIATSGLVALVAGLAAFSVPLFALRAQSPPLPRNGGEEPKLESSVWLIVLLSLPGLCGGLTVSLAVLSMSSRLFPQWLAGTPLAWVLALVVWLLPRSLFLQAWLMRRSDPAAMHLLELLRRSPSSRQRGIAGRWRWRWRIEPQIAAVGLLCYWAYLDLTAAALLAPPGMASVMVRLYNFMHFGHSAAMTMEAAVVMFLPVILWGLMMAVARSIGWDNR